MLIWNLINELTALAQAHGNVRVVTNDECGFETTDTFVGEDDNGDTVVVVD